MARGRFGHRPRSSQNLTSLILSLYQQQKAAEDRVMFDAYQNGGKGLDGKPVTDQKMLGYMKGRQSGFTKDDPLYAEWGNRITQLDFKIGEDKVTLAYQQGKASAGSVAAFYRHQLSTIPQDSEFYRTVAGRAAQWAKAAAGAARSAAGRRLTAAMDAKQNAVQARWDNYSQLTNILTDAAKRAGLIAGNQTLTDADATDLQAFFNAGVAAPNGSKITFSDWQHATLDAYRGFDSLIAINKQLGRGTKELTSQKQSFLDQNLVRVNTVDDRAKYEIARDAFEQATADAKGDPRAILAAASAYAKTLGSIRDLAASGGNGATGNDPEFIGGLANEIEALTTGKSNGGSTVFDLQSTTTEATPSTDLNDTAASIAQAQQDVKALTNGDAFFGQSEFGGAFKVQYLPPGAKLDPNNGLDASFQQSVISLDGVPTKVVLKGQPVQALGLTDPNRSPVASVAINGRQVPIANLSPTQLSQLIAQGYQQTKDSATIGFVFSDPEGKAQKYGVVQPDGSLLFTTANPFGEGLTQTKDGLAVYTGSTTNDQGVVIPNINDRLNLNISYHAPTDAFLADESVTPKDLLALAATSTNQAEVAALTAEADKRTKNAQAERDYMNQAHQGKPSEPGFIGNLVNTYLKNVTDLVRAASAPPAAAEGAGSPMSLALPSLKPVGAPKFGMSAPSVPTPAPAPPPAAPPGEAPTGAAAEKLKKQIDFSTIQQNFAQANSLINPPKGQTGGGNVTNKAL